MHETKKGQAVKVVPKDLPLPSYDYQKPSTGSFSVKYDEKRAHDRGGARDSMPLATLQNLKLAF